MIDHMPGHMPESLTPEMGKGNSDTVFVADMARHSTKGAKPREALTSEGLEKAVEAGLENDYKFLGQVYGSPRERTGQSSVMRMFAEQFKDLKFDDVDPEDVVRWLVAGGLSKTETPFLNFQTGEGEYNKELMENFNAKRYLRWLVDKSDAAAVSFKQSPDKATPVSIQAGNVASYIFAKIWEAYDKKQHQGEQTPVDFATSHQGVLESFLFKAIKKKWGEAPALKFVSDLQEQGFTENEGFTITGEVGDFENVEDWRVKIKYKNTEYVLESRELLDIIKEGEDLKGQLEKLQK